MSIQPHIDQPQRDQPQRDQPLRHRHQRQSGALKRLLRYAKPYVGLIVLAIFFGLANTGAEALRNYLIKPLLDEIVLPQKIEPPKISDLSKGGLGSILKSVEKTTGKGALSPPADPRAQVNKAKPPRISPELHDKIFNILTKALIVVIVAPLALFGKDYLIEFVLGRVRIDIQRSLCRKLLALPLTFHEGTTRGELLSRTTNDVARAHFALRMFFSDVIQSSVRTLTFLGILFWISWQLTLVVLIMGPLLIGVVGLFGKRIRKSAARRQQTLGDLTQRLSEILSGIKVIHAFRGEERESESFANQTRRLFKREMKVLKHRILSRSVVSLVTNSFGITIIMLGAIVLARGQWGLTLGSLAFFLATLQGINRPVKSITKGWNQLMDSLPAAERFFELLDTELGIEDAPDARAISGIHESIRFENVHFSYGREPVLCGIDFDVTPGEVVALVGRTGAGKTTLADLLLRFYDPTKGRIEIDGVDLRSIRHDSLLDHIAVVTQHAFLFQGTIRENIRYGRPDATDEEVLAAARAAHVDEFADTLENGYDTDVGEEGVQISGGQRQRVTIARALLKNPAILIFDEATSSLDAKSERFVHEAIDTLMQGRTVFIIAHRLSTVRHADKMVIMEEGRISQIGTHAELAARDGLYRELLHLQNDLD